MAKETLYIDADDEITSVIDKVISTKQQIVAVVLPKRATVFQSTVNMKLLKKAAESAKKRLVIISSEPAIETIAAVAGIHVAQSLTSKPTIPKRKTSNNETTITSDDLEITTNNDPSHTGKSTDSESKNDDESPIEIDNTIEEAGSDDSTMTNNKKVKKEKAKFKIPDFSSFKLRVGLVVVSILLLVTGWVFGFIILPKATVTVEATTKRIDVSSELTVDAKLGETDLEESVIRAEIAEVSKEDSATVKASGQKDAGERAVGSLTLTNCRQGAAGVVIPAGTGFSAEGKTFITNEAVELGPAVIIGTCRSADFPEFGAVADVGVTAVEPGESYNISAQSHQSPTNGVSAFGSDMTGGTTRIVTVISTDDIKNATEQLSGTATASAITELRARLETQGLRPLDETLQETEGTSRVSGEVDAEAEEVTVTKTVAYTMLGVDSDELSAYMDRTVKDKLDNENENIRSNGLDGAVIRLGSAESSTRQVLIIQAVAVIGQEFDSEKIRNEVAGMKRGDIENLLESREGVQSVLVEYSPIWITTTPKNAEKITIVINEAE